MTTTPDAHSRRLTYVAYANIAAGLLSFVLWALPGPATVRTFWAFFDRMQFRPDDHVFPVVQVVMKTGILVVVVLFWVFSAISIANGILIWRRRRYRTCLVLSGVSIVGTLFGVVIGTVSLVVLMQDWARELFDKRAPTPINGSAPS